MDYINLEQYINNVELQKECSKILSNLNRIEFSTNVKLRDLKFNIGSLSDISRARAEYEFYQYERYEKKDSRYIGSVYKFDRFNELERIGVSRNSHWNTSIVSFEDSLDFIFGCLFRIKQGDLINFCERKNLCYRDYSRCLLGGGHYKELYITDLYGFSSEFDYVIRKIGSDDSIEKKLFYTQLSEFCHYFRDSLMSVLNTSLCNDGNTMLISAGASSLVFNSKKKIDEVVLVKYKIYETKLKTLCVGKGEYLDSLHKCLDC